MSAAGEYPIALQTTAFPVSVSWRIVSSDRSFTLSKFSGGDFAGAQPISGEGETTVKNRDEISTGLVLRVDGENPTPIGYMLGDCYPNPFNPETNFEFRISDFG